MSVRADTGVARNVSHYSPSSRQQELQARHLDLGPLLIGRKNRQSFGDPKRHTGPVAQATAKFFGRRIKSGGGNCFIAPVRTHVEMKSVEHRKRNLNGHITAQQPLDHFLQVDRRYKSVANMPGDKLGARLITKQRQDRG